MNFSNFRIIHIVDRQTQSLKQKRTFLTGTFMTRCCTTKMLSNSIRQTRRCVFSMQNDCVSVCLKTWRLLGLCHAENEQDALAISAYEQSLRYDRSNRKTMLAFAVSLANEGMDSSAFRQLDKWASISDADARTCVDYGDVNLEQVSLLETKTNKKVICSAGKQTFIAA